MPHYHYYYAIIFRYYWLFRHYSITPRHFIIDIIAIAIIDAIIAIIVLLLSLPDYLFSPDIFILCHYTPHYCHCHYWLLIIMILYFIISLHWLYIDIDIIIGYADYWYCHYFRFWLLRQPAFIDYGFISLRHFHITIADISRWLLHWLILLLMPHYAITHYAITPLLPLIIRYYYYWDISWILLLPDIIIIAFMPLAIDYWHYHYITPHYAIDYYYMPLLFSLIAIITPLLLLILILIITPLLIRH